MSDRCGRKPVLPTYLPPTLLPFPLSDPGIALTIYGRYVTMDNPLVPRCTALLPSSFRPIIPHDDNRAAAAAKEEEEERKYFAIIIVRDQFQWSEPANGIAAATATADTARAIPPSVRPSCVCLAPLLHRWSSYLMNHRHRRWRSCPPPPSARPRPPSRRRGGPCLIKPA